MSDEKTVFLIEKYRGWAESMHKSEEQGERRVALFLSLATAVLAGLIALLASQSLPAESWLRLAKGAAVGLLLLGILTFLRMLKRDEATDKAVAEMAAIEDWFRHRGVGWPAPAAPEYRVRKLSDGGLSAIMVWLNSAIFAGIVALALLETGAWPRSVLLLSALALLIAVNAQLLYAHARALTPKPRDPE